MRSARAHLLAATMRLTLASAYCVTLATALTHDQSAAAATSYHTSGAATAQGPIEPRWPNPAHDTGPTRPRRTLGEDFLLDELRWEQWGGEIATGAGKASIHGPGNRSRSYPFEVKVFLSGVANCFGVPIYTTLTVSTADGVEVPTGFSAAALKPIVRRCSIQPQLCGDASSCSRPPHAERFFRRPEIDVNLGRLDDLFSTRISAVGLRWKALGSTLATGTGYVNTKIKLGTSNEVLQTTGEEPRVYPIRLTLSKPRWCGGVMRYTALRARIFGPGIARRKYASPDAIPTGATRRVLDRRAKGRASRSSTARRGVGVRWLTRKGQIDKAIMGCGS